MRKFCALVICTVSIKLFAPEIIPLMYHGRRPEIYSQARINKKVSGRVTLGIVAEEGMSLTKYRWLLFAC